MEDIQVVESYTEFVRDVEPRLKRALVAAFGIEAGLEAASEALAYGWDDLDGCVLIAPSGNRLMSKEI